MRSIKILLLIFILSWSANISSAFAQQSCSIEVKSIVSNAKKGRSTGQIEIQIIGDGDNGRYKLFLLNKGADKAKEEIKDRKLENLKAGHYEFIIIDTKGEKCFKEVVIQVQEVN